MLDKIFFELANVFQKMLIYLTICFVKPKKRKKKKSRLTTNHSSMFPTISERKVTFRHNVQLFL